jgi:CRISPR/Cas system CMR-associated protein Cmr5 small subunit
MPTSLEQLRATHAYEAAATHRTAEFVDLARKLPTMFQQNGLLASWAFLLAKAKGNMQSTHGLAIEVIAAYLREERLGFGELMSTTPHECFLQWIGVNANALSGFEMRRLSDETLAFSGWLKRAVAAYET